VIDAIEAVQVVPSPNLAATGAPPYAVGATISLQEQQFRTLKNGDMFGVFDLTGSISDGGTEGLYNRDTRHLSRFDLRIGGGRPILLSSTLRDDNGSLTCDLTNPDLSIGDKVVLEHDTIHIRRSRFLINATCFERMAVRNFSASPQLLRLELFFDSDFADLFEVRGTPREHRGTRLPTEITETGVVLGYLGLDDRKRYTRIRFDPAPTTLEPNRAVFDLMLQPHERALIFFEITCHDGTFPIRGVRENFMLSMIEARRWMRANSAQAAAIASSNEVFNEAIRRSICDLYMLITQKPTGLYPYAGIPWFSAPFGRDALITAMQTLWLDPSIARGVLSYLAENQATEVDAAADAEPGKILHEVRHGEMALLGEVPFAHYYGSVDSTPLFVMLAGAYVERTHDDTTARRLWPHLEAAIAWIDNYGDRDGDGFVEYYRATENGLANQGWKDSWDSVFHADGTLAKGSIALCEVQGYVYAARRAMALIGRRLGHADVATVQDQKAEALRVAFEASFWCEEIGTYALALDGEKKPCRVQTSNAGQVLLSGIASPDRAARVTEGLMASRFFTGWGVRTVATTEARYNPMAYHNGSVWPHDNAMMGMGLSRYGHTAAVAKIFHGIFDAALYIELRRLPELFCGFARRRGQGPTFYPVACSPQAWASATPFSLIEASLGLELDPRRHEVRLRNPRLPSFLEEVTLRNLQLGGSSVDIKVRRHGDDVSLEVLRTRGNKLQISIVSSR